MKKMKSFRVQGSNWEAVIEIDDSIIERNKDMACEAATQAVEHYLNRDLNKITPLNNESPALGPFVIACEDTSSPKTQSVMFLTEKLLKNAGRPELAKQVRAAINKRYRRIKDENK